MRPGPVAGEDHDRPPRHDPGASAPTSGVLARAADTRPSRPACSTLAAVGRGAANSGPPAGSASRFHASSCASEDIDALRRVVGGMPEDSDAPLMGRARNVLAGR